MKFEELKPAAKRENLEFAFSLAEKLGIPKLIEPTDSKYKMKTALIYSPLIIITVLVESGPNKFFVITYLAQYVFVSLLSSVFCSLYLPHICVGLSTILDIKSPNQSLLP